eukprot:CAMPEP_0197518120 /NCGR_PEP_ID=MMETSP1318-20131121/3255_1 /TAXON_ID=552666 /ORGANISM="Partenskyella glossopodia, Strain RCC365" /LENGTH=175 /DNA_ID=CAMNT_0043068217 /DNA_START=40 /DNA_END=564 /DNA_ORIENTATION=+
MGTGTSTSSNKNKNAERRIVPAQVDRIEFWIAPHEYGSAFPPEKITIDLFDAKETIGEDQRSFVVCKNKKEQYFSIGLVGASLESKELSKQDRINLRIAKSTKGYKMIRVVQEAQIKPYLNIEQIQRWASRNGEDGEKKDCHRLSMYLFNRACLDEKKSGISEKRSGFVGGLFSS